MGSIQNILIDINSFKPINGNWLELDSLVGHISIHDLNENVIESLLHVFEKYPNEDGAGVFWSILHLIESFESYDNFVLKSFENQPSEMTFIMLQRIINSSVRITPNKEIIEAFKNALGKEISKDIKENINYFLSKIKQ
jgi:hypothetical protein